MTTPPPLLAPTPDMIAETILATMDEPDAVSFGAALFDALRDRDRDLAAAFALGVADASEVA